MAQPLADLSPQQWEFLSVLEALAGPASIDLACLLVPLPPGPLFDLLGKTESLGWVIKSGHDHFAIGPNLPAEMRQKMADLNQPDRLARIVDILTSSAWAGTVEPAVMLGLLDKAGRVKEASTLQLELAKQALTARNFAQAQSAFQQALARVRRAGLEADVAGLFISGTLELSNLSFFLGRGLPELEECLHISQELATLVGDRRSHALISLHLGRWYYFSGRRMEALVAFSLGLTEVEELGDDDILAQAAEFTGINFFLQGRHRQALEYLEKAGETSAILEESRMRSPTAVVFVGYCSIYLGQFHRAVGFLDFHWWRALERADLTPATTIRAVLGTALVLLNKKREAFVHLEGAQEEAIRDNNALGLYLARGGMALSHFLAGQTRQAYDLIKLTAREGGQAGLVRQYASPWVLEMLAEFHRLGFSPIPELHYTQMMAKAWDEPNVHLRGVAFRLLAMEKLARGMKGEVVAEDLEQSEKYLLQAGDPLQLSKTKLEKAKLALRANNRPEARRLAQEAWRVLGGYAEDFFPDEFKFLLEKRELEIRREENKRDFIQQYLEMIQELLPGQDQRHILNKLVSATCRLFGAERGALFWFPKGIYIPQPELRAGSNLVREDVQAEEFRPYLNLVLKAFQQKQPLVVRADPATGKPPNAQSRSVLCLPIEARAKVRGVLYLDNSYRRGAFDFVDLGTLQSMARHSNAIIERLLDYLRLKEEWQVLAQEKIHNQEQLEREPMIARDPITLDLLALADKVASSDSTVLILGETGTGKELLARRIHNKSPRRPGPLIVVDSTAIPENLVESELFGYEKGAFTGADQRKIGRVEQAHGGTLFLDEIGELPLVAQSKLLRALQEKTIQRVGGMRPITSDFRLIAATNRHLAAEVAAGRFRQDLYYRLNVVPLTLPPLRNRPEDIVALARHFLDIYSRKYHQTRLSLTPDDEKTIKAYSWPGNVRELRNVIERAVIMSSGTELQLNLPSVIGLVGHDPFSDRPSLDEIQRRYIKHILEQTGGQVGGPGGAAEILGMKRTSLYSRMKQLGMSLKP